METDQTPDPFDGRLLVGSAELRSVLPSGRTTFYKLIHSPGFPKPLQLVDDGEYVWWSAEVRAWLERRRVPALTAARQISEPEQSPSGDDEPAVRLQPARSRTGVATVAAAVPARDEVVLRPADPGRRRRAS